MSKAKKNGRFLEWLQDMRDDEDPDSNKYMILNKAFNSLKKETKEYPDPHSLIAVKFIGPKIISDLNKRWKDDAMKIMVQQHASKSSSTRKCKKATGTSSIPAEPKRHGLSKQPLPELHSDDDDVLPEGKRCASIVPPRESQFTNFQNNMSLASSVPQIPSAPHPQTYQPYLGKPLESFHPSLPKAPYEPYQFSPHIYQQSSNPISSELPPSDPTAALPNSGSIQPFNFSYIDGDGKLVFSHDKAVVDIETDTLWYKICFLDCAESKAGLLRQRVRLDSYENRTANRRDELVRAWISDQDVDYFNLHMAPGFVPPRNSMDTQGMAENLKSKSHTATRYQEDDVGINTAPKDRPSETWEIPRASLEDLLVAERKKKRNTIDPTRIMDVDMNWELRKGSMVSTSSNGAPAGEKEEKRVNRDKRESMRQHSAMMTMARHQPSSTAAGPSFSSSSQPQFPSAPVINPMPRDTNTHTFPLISNANHDIPRATKDVSLPCGSGSTHLRNVAPSDPCFSSNHAVTTPAVPSGVPVVIPKRQRKGKLRGRVSEFAPPLPAVDELDIALDNEVARRRMNAENIMLTSISHGSADLIDNVTNLSTVAATSFPDFHPIILPRGSFDIFLVLDNREVKSQKHRDYIAIELQKKGVHVLRRSLTLGDVLWIARPYGTEEVECVLDYILERKRLDDLCLSIKDGRFREQKFRLANTGLKVFYLIEEYDLEKNREVFGVQIDTARSSTQIVDGFIVKETKNLCCTIDFLATMHQTILEEYQNEPLYMIPPHLIKRHSYMMFQKHLRNNQPTIRYLTSYTCFEKLNSKSGNLTTKDLFAQMLLCIKGVSAEKASAIIGVYPTMRSLWEAFRTAEAAEMEGVRLEDDETAITSEQLKTSRGGQKKYKGRQAKTMLCELEAIGRQRIGPTLSANVYRLMRANSYEE